MEQLNAQTLSNHEGKHMKALCAPCGDSLVYGILSFSAACNETLFMSLDFQFHPPVNLMHDWEGMMSAWRGRRGDEGKEMDNPLVSLVFFTELS